MDAGFGLRSLAALIDVCFFSVAALSLFIVIVNRIVDMDGVPLRQTRGAWVFQIFIFVGAALYLASEALFGKTLGKACLNIKVTAIESHSFRHPFLMRWIFRCLPLIPGILISIAMLMWLHFQEDSAFVESFGRDLLLPLILPLATLLIMYLATRIPFGTERRAWYDCAAGTSVVRRGRPRSARGFEPIISQ